MDKVLKMNLLGGMCEYVVDLGDEIAYMMWVNIVPDGWTEEDLEFIVEDKELWTDCCKLFGRIVERFGE